MIIHTTYWKTLNTISVKKLVGNHTCEFLICMICMLFSKYKMNGQMIFAYHVLELSVGILASYLRNCEIKLYQSICCYNNISNSLWQERTTYNDNYNFITLGVIFLTTILHFIYYFISNIIIIIFINFNSPR